MKKETIIKIFENNKTTNFSIITNIAEGKGINGVAFNTHIGCVQGKKEYSDEQYVVERTKILGFMEDCIVLEKYVNNAYWQGGEHTIYLPFDNIVTIDFRKGDSSRFPIKLPFKHNLKTID